MEQKIKLALFIVTHEKSPQLHRTKAIQNMIEEYLLSDNPAIKLNVQHLTWQPQTSIKVSRSFFLFLRFRVRSYRSWYGYGKTVSFLRGLFFEAKLFFQGRSIVQMPRQLVYVATVLSQKNVRAWEIMMDSDFDAALVLEDDAILNVKNIDILSDSLKLIKSTQPMYFNLAKGNDLSSYIVKDSHFGNDSIKWSRAPIADTTCAYLLNFSCAEILLNEYRKTLKYDCMNIDFILSDIFIQNTGIVVLHNPNPPFVNGTIFGDFQSQTGATVRKNF